MEVELGAPGRLFGGLALYAARACVVPLGSDLGVIVWWMLVMVLVLMLVLVGVLAVFSGAGRDS